MTIKYCSQCNKNTVLDAKSKYEPGYLCWDCLHGVYPNRKLTEVDLIFREHLKHTWQLD